MLEGILVILFIGLVVGSLVKLWIEGSLFEDIHNLLFNFCYEEIENEEQGTSEIIKRKGLIRGLFRGLTCAFCFTWELSLVATYRFNFSIWDSFDSITLSPIEAWVTTSAIIVLIAWTTYAILTRVREESH